MRVDLRSALHVPHLSGTIRALGNDGALANAGAALACAEEDRAAVARLEERLAAATDRIDRRATGGPAPRARQGP